LKQPGNNQANINEGISPIHVNGGTNPLCYSPAKVIELLELGIRDPEFRTDPDFLAALKILIIYSKPKLPRSNHKYLPIDLTRTRPIDWSRVQAIADKGV